MAVNEGLDPLFVFSESLDKAAILCNFPHSQKDGSLVTHLLIFHIAKHLIAILFLWYVVTPLLFNALHINK